VIAYSSLKGQDIDLELAEEALKGLIDSGSNVFSIEKIQKAVAQHYKIKISQLKSKNNSPKIAFPRQVGMYLAKKLTNASLPEIGRKFGGKHHTTVLHSLRKIERLLEESPDFHRELNNLINHIR
ncbi:MAG TPA: chromosomal replication initiator protein DnaA, partial [Candidatus Aminicenantes bacterium]|nr:chromosomal replication initiator protein DnaA [Candidatus Aminicenantes bacterium]